MEHEVGGIVIIGVCIAIKGTPCLFAVLGIWVILTVIDVLFTYRIAQKN